VSQMSKRLANLEKAYRKALISNSLYAIIIRSDEDLAQHKANIGPDTKIIRIVARKEKVGLENA
jgi:hypothetical protein